MTTPRWLVAVGTAATHGRRPTSRVRRQEPGDLGTTTVVTQSWRV